MFRSAFIKAGGHFGTRPSPSTSDMLKVYDAVNSLLPSIESISEFAKRIGPMETKEYDIMSPVFAASVGMTPLAEPDLQGKDVFLSEKNMELRAMDKNIAATEERKKEQLKKRRYCYCMILVIVFLLI